MTAPRPAPAPQLEWDAPDWRDDALCRASDPELWFPIGDDPAKRSEAETAKAETAKAICRRCTVRTECLESAMARHEPCGIWGGLDVDDRRSLARRRNRQARADAMNTAALQQVAS